MPQWLMQKNDIEKCNIYISWRKKNKLNDHFSQFSNFADTAVLQCTAAYTCLTEDGNAVKSDNTL